ncbi:uncharacterized protein LOC136030231 [Artemia franciscana]|uniref:RING finger protein 17 n=1 Tax=Artemia franciscana TaxID=6661 RepID=A0AA88H7T6_ARTSF|nr:hypothetical protein QYM36_016489 [Artemia franciscana]
MNCDFCRNKFAIREYFRPGNGVKIPLLLKCSHPICDVCLKQFVVTDLKTRRSEGSSIRCRTCGSTTELNLKTELLQPQKRTAANFSGGVYIPNNQLLGLLPIDYFTVGLLFANSKRQDFSGNDIKFVSRGRKHEGLSYNSNKVCGECLTKKADLYCSDCKNKYCSPCFKNVHQSRILSKHEAHQIDLSFLPNFPEEICEEHKLRKEYYCEEDQVECCSTCAISNLHRDHDVARIIDKVKSQQEAAYDIGLQTRSQICMTLSQLSSIESSLKQKNTKIVDHIKIEFLKFERKLQIVLSSVEDIVQQKLEFEAIESKKLVEFLDKECEKLENSLKSLESWVEKSPTNYAAALDHLEEVAQYNDLPTLLSSKFIEKSSDVKPSQPCHSSITSTLPPEYQQFYDALQNFLKSVAFDIIGETPKLIRPSELGEHGRSKLQKLIERPTVSLPTSLPTRSLVSASERSRHSSISSDTGSEVSWRPLPAVQLTANCRKPIYEEKPTHGQKFKRRIDYHKANDMSRKIIICHVNSPLDFYIQKVVEREEYRKIEDKFISYAEQLPPDQGLVDTVQTGQRYLVRSVQYESWYRGEILDEIESSSTISEENITKHRVFYIDFGNIEELTKDRLRVLPEEFTQLRGIAIHSALEDFAPRSSGFSSEAIETFREYSDIGVYTMQVFRVKDDIHYIDFGRPSLTDFVDDGILSVRDAMVWLKHGMFMYGKPDTTVNFSNMKYPTRDEFPVDTKYLCRVTYAESPDELYLHLWNADDKSNIIDFEEMNQQMQLLYNSDTAKDLNFFTIEKGIICAAPYLDKQWYRAIVLETYPDRKILIRYVDYGNKLVLRLSQVRKMARKFTALPAQAVRCKLFEITPSNPSRKWTNEAKKLVVDLEDKPQLLCEIRKVGSIRNELYETTFIYHITLLEESSDYDISVTGHLVEEGLATSTGPSSRIANHKRPDKANGKPLPKSLKLQEDRDPTLIKHYDRTKVRIAHVEDLDHIFLKSLSHDFPHKKFSAYMADLPKIKDVKSLEKVDKVAYYDKVSEVWRRASLKTIYCKRGLAYAEVHDLDIGSTSDVPALELKPILDKTYLKQRPDVSCAKLAGIKPPGITGKWPETSNLFFSSEFCGKDFLCEKIEKSLESTWVVNLFREDLEDDGPLSPPKVVLRNLARLLVEEGLALPKESSENEQLLDKEVNTLEEPETESQQEVPTFLALEKPLNANWQPHLPFRNKEFIGRVTWVNMNCEVSIQDIEAADEKLEMLTRLISLAQRGTEEEVINKEFQTGAPCFARYNLDNKWYRAQITGKADDGRGYYVVFVDFGNEEITPVSNLREGIILDEIPMQCTPCSLYNIAPVSDKWEIGDLDIIHEMIVDKEVKIRVDNFGNEDQQPQISIILSSGQNFNSLLVSKSMAKYKTPPALADSLFQSGPSNAEKSSARTASPPKLVGFENHYFFKDDSSDAVKCNQFKGSYGGDTTDDESGDSIIVESNLDYYFSEEESCNQEKLRKDLDMEPDKDLLIRNNFHWMDPSGVYGSWQYPGEHLLPLAVSAVFDPTTLFVQPRRLSVDNNNYQLTAASQKWVARVETFEALSCEINKLGSHLPPLLGYAKGSACVALYSDNHWYRGVVTTEDNKPVVYFVDYGNHEPIDKSSIRDCPPVFESLPPFGAYATLDKVELNDALGKTLEEEEHLAEISGNLLEELLQAQDKLWGVFQVRESSLYVRLFLIDDFSQIKNPPSALENLIAKGYFTKAD